MLTAITIGSVDLDKWLHQNKAEDSALDFVVGCLLDNMIVQTKRGFAAIYEKYLNPNSSCYYIEFQPGDAPDVWEAWERFAKENRDEAC